MSLARIIRIVFGVVAGIMLLAALANILWFGRLTLISPFSFGALLVVALAFLLNNLLTAREREKVRNQQTAQLKTVAGRLPALMERLTALHPYELPEIVAVEAAAGLPAYLDWVADATRE